MGGLKGNKEKILPMISLTLFGTTVHLRAFNSLGGCRFKLKGIGAGNLKGRWVTRQP
jgi:hypothetical protein